MWSSRCHCRHKTPLSLACFKSRLVFTARCWASAVLAMALCPSVSVCHKSEFCWNGWTNRAGFWHGSFIRPMLWHQKIESLGYEWVLPKWAWSGSREQFLHCWLRKFRHSKSSVYRRYTQLDRRRFVYDAWDNGSWLGRVMVECTLSITHCL